MNIDRLHAQYGDAEKCIAIMQELIGKIADLIEFEHIHHARMGALKRDLAVADRDMFKPSGRARFLVNLLNRAMRLHASEIENKRLYINAACRTFLFHSEQLRLAKRESLIKSTIAKEHLTKLDA